MSDETPESAKSAAQKLVDKAVHEIMRPGAQHYLMNSMHVLSTTPDEEIMRWMEASFILLTRLAGPNAKNIERQRTRADLDGKFEGLCYIRASIRFSGELTEEAKSLKARAEIEDAKLRTPVVDVKKMKPF